MDTDGLLTMRMWRTRWNEKYRFACGLIVSLGQKKSYFFGSFGARVLIILAPVTPVIPLIVPRGTYLSTK